jgi:Uncharacterized protein with SCP/PR1 domains
VLILTLGLGGILQAFVLPPLGLNFATVLPAIVSLLTNDVRSSENIAKLTTNEKLTQAAQAKANDMATRSYFAHSSPEGRTPWYWIDQAGYKYEYAGENLAVNFEESEEVVKAWLKSPGHRFNLLGRNYTDIGVGVAQGLYKGKQATFVVQMFASPAK